MIEAIKMWTRTVALLTLISLATAANVFAQNAPDIVSLSIEARQWSLPQQLRRFSASSSALHRVDKSVPDAVFFLCINSLDAPAVRNQIKLLFSNAKWVYDWSEAKSLDSKDKIAFTLTRRQRSPSETKEDRVSEQMEAVKSLQKLTLLSPEELEAVSKEYPDELAMLRASDLHARAELLNALPDDIIKGVIKDDQPVNISIRDLPEMWQETACRGAAGSVTVETDPQGKSRTIFDEKMFAEKGVIRLFTASMPDGTKELRLGLCVADAPGDIYYIPVTPHHDDLAANRRVAAEIKRQKSVENVLGKAADKNITILRDTKLIEAETPLGAYLREFTRQTGLSLLATWPNQEIYREKLKRSIIRESIWRTLDILATNYRSKWAIDNTVIRFYPLTSTSQRR